MTPDEHRRVVRIQAIGSLDELVEAVMGLAAEDLAAGRGDAADSATTLAALVLTFIDEKRGAQPETDRGEESS